MATFSYSVTDYLDVADREDSLALPRRLTQEFVTVDGLTGTRRLTQEFVTIDGITGGRKLTQIFASVDIPAWGHVRLDALPLYDTAVATKIVAPHEQMVYTCVATDGLLLDDWATPQTTWAPRWDFWGDADYYREVAAVMRVQSMTY